MKKLNLVFDLFLYESIFTFFFSLPLDFLNDPFSNVLFDISIVSFIITAVLGITGYSFSLFKKERTTGDFE